MKLTDWIEIYGAVWLLTFGIGTWVFLYWWHELRDTLGHGGDRYAYLIPKERRYTKLGLALIGASFVWPLAVLGVAVWGLKLLTWQVLDFIKDPEVGLVPAAPEPAPLPELDTTPQDRTV